MAAHVHPDSCGPCPLCGAAGDLMTGSEVYPHRPDLASKLLWRCSGCKQSHVGCHPNTTSPLGTLADEKLRKARREAHDAFDPLWKRRFMGRAEAYAWLAGQLGIEVDATHIAWFDASMCERVKQVCKARHGR